MTYLQLYWSFFQIGLFSFGGGMAAIPLIQAEVVEAQGWLTMTEFIDLVTIAEMLPGPIAVTSATFVGMQITNIWGAIVAVLGCITPSCVIVTLLAWVYHKYKELYAMQGFLSGLRLAIVALIASAGMTILVLSVFGEDGLHCDVMDIDYIAVVLMTVGVVLLRKCKKIKPIQVMLGSGVLGGVVYLMLGVI